MPSGRTYLQGFGGDTSNALIAAAAAGRERRLCHASSATTSSDECACSSGTMKAIDTQGVAIDASAAYRHLLRQARQGRPYVQLPARRLRGEPHAAVRRSGAADRAREVPARVRDQPGYQRFGNRHRLSRHTHRARRRESRFPTIPICGSSSGRWTAPARSYWQRFRWRTTFCRAWMTCAWFPDWTIRASIVDWCHRQGAQDGGPEAGARWLAGVGRRSPDADSRVSGRRRRRHRRRRLLRRLLSCTPGGWRRCGRPPRDGPAPRRR